LLLLLVLPLMLSQGNWSLQKVMQLAQRLDSPGVHSC
jgi:hypothetical protein